MQKQKRFDIMNYFSAIRIFVAIFISLLIVFIIIFFVSDNPWYAISEMMLGPLKTKRSFFSVIARSVPLIFTALALNVSLRSGVFNIGTEGSFYMGAVVASTIALKVPMPTILHQLVCLFAAMLVGGIINMIPVIIMRYTNISATVLAIMFNSIFFYLGLSIVSKYLLERSGSWGSAPFPESAKFSNLISGTSITWGFVVLIIVIVFVVVLMEKTSFGYKVRLTGINPNFARSAGIKTGAVVLGAQFIGGAIGGMGGAIEKLGMYKRFLWQNQSQVNFVWDGLLVHMLANQNPLFIPLTGFFIAYLRIGAEIMSRSAGLDPEIVAFLQGIVILLVASDKFLYPIKRRHEQKLALQQVAQVEKEVVPEGGNKL